MQMEIRYEYAPDGQISKVSTIDQTDSEWTGHGPEKYVVNYEYDVCGRLVRKAVMDNSSYDNALRFESRYEFDGMGRMIREHILRYSQTSDRLITTQEK
jgi:hypothetical protein